MPSGLCDTFSLLFQSFSLLLIFQVEDKPSADDFKTRVEKLNIAIREDKTNVDNWLKLVALQDGMSGCNCIKFEKALVKQIWCIFASKLSLQITRKNY